MTRTDRARERQKAYWTEEQYRPMLEVEAHRMADFADREVKAEVDAERKRARVLFQAVQDVHREMVRQAEMRSPYGQTVHCCDLCEAMNRFIEELEAEND